MPDQSFGTLAPARISGPAFRLCAAGIAVALAFAVPAVAAPSDDHQEAVAALVDVKAAITELVQADASYATDRNVYHAASQRAINLLTGEHGPGYIAGAGEPTDAAGAIGHIDGLLDRKETPVWTAPLHGAEANMRAAIAYLQDSLKARELMDYQIAASRALTYLEVARGRPTEIGVLGGLEGALANTALGVPAGATQVDGCKAPSAAPAYGTHDGYLAWVTVPGGDGSHALAEAPGGTELEVHGGFIILHTAAASVVTAACGSHAQADSQHATLAATQPTAQAMIHLTVAEATAQQPVEAAASTQAAGQSATADPPALYTKAQAEQGAQIFATTCAKCHGENLQGTAGPAVAGDDFLTTAQHNGWTLAVVRYLVVNNMPLNASSKPSPTQYAALMAFLLASNCYPAGNTPFPTTAEPAFGDIKLGPVPGEHSSKDSRGVCKVD
jgi:polar amino acid transport system substrate-binding protein